MNSKSTEQHKSAATSKKTQKNKNGEPEVLIIPPNLLQQFGITLGDIQPLSIISAQEVSTAIDKKIFLDATFNSTEGKVVSHTTRNKHLDVKEDLSINKETSILETANLMKESVFLSPTFVPTIANIIPGEVEIIGASGKPCNINEARAFDIPHNTSNNIDVKSASPPGNKPNTLESCENDNEALESRIDNNQLAVKTINQEPKEITNALIGTQSETSLSSFSSNKVIGNIKKLSNEWSIEDKESFENNFVTNFMESFETIKSVDNLNLNKSNIEKNKVLIEPSESECRDTEAQIINVKANDCIKVELSKPQNKIKIISEEIFNYKTLPEHKFTKSSHSNNFILLTMDTVISKKEKLDLASSNSTTSKSLNTDNKNQFNAITTNDHEPKSPKTARVKNSVDDIVSLSQISNDITLPLINNCNVLDNTNKCVTDGDSEQVLKCTKNLIVEESNKHSTHISNSMINILNTNHHDSETSEIIYCDDLSKTVLNCNKEARECTNSEHLSLVLDRNIITDDKNNTHFDLKKSDETSQVVLPILVSNEEKSKKSVKGQSKFCVQGIEKPGGNEELNMCNMSLKTYFSRKSKSDKKPAINTQNQSNTDTSKNDDDITLDNDAYLVTTLKNLEYCLCDDFGRLKNYDYTDIPNEHIHFRHIETVNCDPEIIYGIYHDDIQYKSQQDVELTENLSSENDISNICWNSIYTKSCEILLNSNLLSTSKACRFLEENVEKSITTKLDATNSCNIQPLSLSHTNKIVNHSNNNETNLDFNVDVDKTQESPMLVIQNETVVEDNKELKTGHKQIPLQFDIGRDMAISNEKTSTEKTTPQLHQTIKKTVSDEKKSKCNNNTKLMEIASGDKFHSKLNLQITEQIKSRSPQKVYPSVARGFKRNINEINDSTFSSTPEPVEKKRCNSMNDSMLSPPTQQRQPKKVKCRRCHRVLAKEDWEEHAFRDHLKWNITQKKDLENDKLHEKLNKMLNVSGFLKCDFCMFKVNHIPTFILHIEQCIDQWLDKKFMQTQIQGASKTVTCGVCKNIISSHLWLNHIRIYHDYLAWKEGEPYIDLNNETDIRRHLRWVLKKVGELKCECGFTNKLAKSFRTHMKTCSKKNTVAIKTESTSSTNVECGVCKRNIDPTLWLLHIQTEHNYLAWKSNETPLNLKHEIDKLQHLNAIVSEHKSLVCGKCGLIRRYANSYLSHIDKCSGKTLDNSCNTSLDTSQLDNTQIASLGYYQRPKRARLESMSSDFEENESLLSLSEKKSVICGVCALELTGSSWIKHIEEEHNYLAWKVGQTKLDLEDEECIRQHLYSLSKKLGGLLCVKCNCRRKYVKSYLEHTRTCCGKDEIDVGENNDETSKSSVDSDRIICGVCKKNIKKKRWNKHIQKAHNYLAWKDGEAPIKLEDEEEVRQYLCKLMKTFNFDVLICSKCKCVRKYAKPYLEHLKVCQELNFSPDHDKNKIHEGDKEFTTLEDKSVKCGVCNEEMLESLWIDHIQNKHNYLAWKDGETALDLTDEEAVRNHLYVLAKNLDGLMCVKCKCVRRYVKHYLGHIRTCNESNKVDITENETVQEKVADSSTLKDKFVKCGVCNQELLESLWIEHIENEHNYLAWKDGEPALDLTDKEAVRNHLYVLTKKLDGLMCVKCKCVRRYVKHYLEHIRICNESNNDDITENETFQEQVADSSTLKDTFVKCGICNQELLESLWIEHIENEHNYLAWRDGEPALNLSDEEAVRNHLYMLTKKLDGLVCVKCKCVRRYAKPYLEHIKVCQELNFSSNHNKDKIHEDYKEFLTLENKSVKCGVCNEEMLEPLWIDHIQNKHNYLAWKDGETALDLTDEEAVRNHLYVLTKKLDGLMCVKCKCVRRYVKSYLEHIKTCNETNTIAIGDEKVEEKKLNANSLEDKSIKCGVCNQEILESYWIRHIQNEHKYLAWKDGDLALDIDDEDAVRLHLYTLMEKLSGLQCTKCKCVKRSVKSYLQHIKSCNEQDSAGNGEKIKEEIENNSEHADIFDTMMVKCGVCDQEMQKTNWIEHIAVAHNYLAWIKGEPVLDLDDELAVRLYLCSLSKKLGGLLCSKCNRVRKYVKNFLEHVKECNGSDSISAVNSKRTQRSTVSKSSIKIITCAVCKLNMQSSLWYDHIGNKHNYLAWIDGKTPLNFEDEECIKEHLYAVSKALNGLICSKCGLKRKYVKVYLEHINNCTGVVELDDSLLNKTIDNCDINNETKCGVCSKVIEPGHWMKHIQVAHNYLAWKDWETPIDVNNDDDVRQHLTKILRREPTLICPKCGFTRKIAKAYQYHMKICEIGSEEAVCENRNSLLLKNKGMFECAICHEKVLPAEWDDHAMNNHYNIAWVVGDIPINLKSPYGADRHLRKYQEKKGKLVCKNCHTSRASLMGFYVHVITCGKTEEETAIYKDKCDICGKLYLAVYKSQHMTMHREQELAKERKMEIQPMDIIPESLPSRRRAAEIANSVIVKYNNDNNKYVFVCKKCGFGTDDQVELDEHKCHLDEDNDVGLSDDDSIDASSDDCNYTDVSEESDNKNVIDKKKHSEMVRQSWMPFKLINGKDYLEKTIKDFRAAHLAEEILFVNWKSFDFEYIQIEDVTNYIPKLLQSCHVNSRHGWMTYNRFEGKYDKEVYSMFVGGSINCISWVPPSIHENKLNKNYLTVVCHTDGDSPRVNFDDVVQHPGLIQIWDVGNFHCENPTYVLGLAHDYGTVWAIDWCPSGARDEYKEDSEEKTLSRLGLLAIACSNGSAYILSVPYPETVSNSCEKFYIKLKPVAELRFNMKPDRKVYQATSVKWSKKNGHAVIVVGYSDGHLALFDLTNESPLLRCTENNTTIFYPYHDERMLNSCLTAVDLFPARGECLSDAVCGASPTGAAAAVGGSRVVSRLSVNYASFTPAWPVALLSGEDGLVTTSSNELEWHGSGRRLGPLRTAAGCGRCGRVLIYSPPLLHTTRLFSPCIDANKTIVASITLKHLNLKRTSAKFKNDELSMRIEPMTYDDTIKKFGIDLVVARHKFKPGIVPKEPYPERFPLADVTSLAYCPSGDCHEMAAVATHAGLIFIFKAQ